MDLTQLETAARNKYNSIGDSFYSSAEIYDLLYEGSLEMATETQIVEGTYSTSTVIGQQEYSLPTNTMAIKRITYNGQKLMPIDFREDDQLTLNNSNITDTGTSQYYMIWNDTIILRPIPGAVVTLKIYSINEPQPIVAGSVIEIPTMFHMDLVNFVVSEMCAKDENTTMAAYYRSRWDRAVAKAKRWHQKRKRTDGMKGVKDEEDAAAATILGTI